jgi:hypothetical protein
MNTMLTYTIEGYEDGQSMDVEVLSEDKVVNIHVHGWNSSLSFCLDKADAIKDLGNLLIEASSVAE